jgi:hypothetical protein
VLSMFTMDKCCDWHWSFEMILYFYKFD